MSRVRWMIRGFFAVNLALLSWGCSQSTSNPPQISATGQHPAVWAQKHWAEYVKAPDTCRTCHGSTSDPAAAGGISKISCFTCHAQGVNHPAGWADPGQHGRLGAELAPVLTDPKVMAGLAHCTKCHGDDYSGGVTGISCKGCHTKAPHPDKPWLGTTVTKTNHTITQHENAPECFKCHGGGNNSDLKPSSTPAAGTAPGCFNNTLCHGNHFGG